MSDRIVKGEKPARPDGAGAETRYDTVLKRKNAKRVGLDIRRPCSRAPTGVIDILNELPLSAANSLPRSGLVPSPLCDGRQC